MPPSHCRWPRHEERTRRGFADPLDFILDDEAEEPMDYTPFVSRRVHRRWRLYAFVVTGFMVGYLISDWGLL